MADCPKCKKYIETVSRSLEDVYEVTYSGEVFMSSQPRHTKFKHDCGYEFEELVELGGSYTTLVDCIREEEEEEEEEE